MVRNFGRGIVVALLFAAGCEDTRMDLLPPPPPEAAGKAGSAMAGMAGHTPAGDGGTGGMGANGGSGAVGAGGFGATGGTGTGVPCQPGTYPPGTRCCNKESDCSNDLPFCSYGRCVECVVERDEPQRGCAPNELCDPNINICIPPCTSDDDCGEGHCDQDRNVCVQCTDDNHCKNNGKRSHCATQYGFCVECTESPDCSDDEKHPICSGFRCVECSSSSECTKDPGRTACSLSEQLPNVCVECTRNDDKACEEMGQVCNEIFASCVDCVSSQHCAKPTPICRQDNHCVECLVSDHCTDATAPVCRPDGRCYPCSSNQECAPGTCEDDGSCTPSSQNPPQP